MPKVEDLISRMSLADKIGQMTQVAIDVVCNGEPYKVDIPITINDQKLEEAISTWKVGSILNVGTFAHSLDVWNELIDSIQKSALEKNGLKIPVLYGIDSIHGANFMTGSTLYPQQLALASTWNKSLVEDLSAICAYETKAAGIPWNFSPVLDLGRNPLWPRIWETFGEDVHLCTEMGEAMVKGMQGEDISQKDKLAACMKHFLGYGTPLSGKDRTPAWISERQLREYFLPPFQRAVDIGAATVMINSGEINGIPVHINKFILTTILRDELGFKGLAVTDWEDIKYLHDRHRVAPSHKEAVRMAIEAGIDMSMVPMDFSFSKYLTELVEEGAISEERIDLSVKRILQLKIDLGLFEKTSHGKDSYPLYGGKEFQAKSKTAALESLILLKNDKDFLPLSKKSKVLVCGPTANSMQCLNGGWSYTWQGDRTDEFTKEKNTIKNAIQNKIGSENIKFVEGCGFDEIINLEQTLDAAKNSDAIILCLGEDSYTEFFGSINDLTLPAAQLDFAQALIETGKPIVLVLVEGRPRVISKVENNINAILLSFLPGNEGGDAFADVIFGDYNPSGKLPINYPRHPNSLENYDYKYTENLPLQGVPPLYNPHFNFGFGLSYTKFEYSDLKLSKTQISEQEEFEINVKVTNTGEVAGHEIIPLYISDLFASITPSNKRLRAFEKIFLEANESKEISFIIKAEELAFVNQQNVWVVEPGEFKIQIENLTAEFTYL